MILMTRFLLLALAVMTLSRCHLPPADARPIPGLEEVPLLPVAPLPPPSPTPFAGVVVTIVPEDGPVDMEAEILLSVTIADEVGRPLAGMVSVLWPEKGGRLDYGPLTEVRLDLLASGPFGGPHIIRVWAEGYVPQEWYFAGGLSENTVYLLLVRLAQGRRDGGNQHASGLETDGCLRQRGKVWRGEIGGFFVEGNLRKLAGALPGQAL